VIGAGTGRFDHLDVRTRTRRGAATTRGSVEIAVTCLYQALRIRAIIGPCAERMEHCLRAVGGEPKHRTEAEIATEEGRSVKIAVAAENQPVGRCAVESGFHDGIGCGERFCGWAVAAITCAQQ